MFSQRKNNELCKPSEQFNSFIKSIVSGLNQKNISTELKQPLNCLIQVFHDFSHDILKEEINRPEFELDYNLRKKEKVLQLQVKQERDAYQSACTIQDQKIQELENKLHMLKEKILKTKLNTILEDLHEIVIDNKLHLAIEDKIDALTNTITDYQSACSFFDCAGRSAIKEAEKEIATLQKRRDALNSKDTSILQKTIIMELEEQQTALEKQIDTENRKKPAKPSLKLSNELSTVTAKLTGGEERHNASLSREAMFRVLHIYVLYKHLLRSLTTPEPIRDTTDDKAILLSKNDDIKNIFRENEAILEKLAGKFWCPDSGNRELRHFYKGFVNLTSDDQNKFITSSNISPSLIDKIMPVNANSSVNCSINNCF
jgi:hypothetical protein